MLSSNDIQLVKEQAYAGYPSQLKKVCDIYPTMMDDFLKNSVQFSGRLGLLLLTETEIVKIIKEKTGKEPLIDNIDVLSFLLQNANQDDSFLLELQAAFSTFIKEDVLLLPSINCVLVGSPEDKRMITKDNFLDFQTILRIQNRREVPEPPPENESEIAKKYRLKRELREAVKRKQQQKEGGTQDLAELLEIAEVFGIDYKQKSLYAFYGLIHRYQLKEKWDQDIRMLCAGADSQKIKAQYWGASQKEN